MLRILAFLLAAAPPAFSQQPPVRILIAYYSVSGNTETLARAVRDGAASVPGAEPLLRKIADATPAEIAAADGIILGTPVYWQGLAPESKRFLDRVGEALGKSGKEFGEGRTAAVFCTAGAVSSGKDLARVSALASFLGMRFIAVGGVDDDGFGTLGAQATTGPADPGVSDKERAEARRFGERFARITRQFKAGAGR
jgi:NAD(P)H dehydrogenase (quinone)